MSSVSHGQRSEELSAKVHVAGIKIDEYANLVLLYSVPFFKTKDTPLHEIVAKNRLAGLSVGPHSVD